MNDLNDFLKPQYIIDLTEKVNDLYESRKDDLEYLIQKISDYLSEELHIGDDNND